MVLKNSSHGVSSQENILRRERNGIALAMPFLSFLPAIKYFGHFQNPDTFVVDIYLLSAVDFAMGIGRRVNDDLLNELMQDTGCRLRDIGVLTDNRQKPVNIGTFTFYFFDFLTEYRCLRLQTSLFRFIFGGQLVETLVCQLAADVVLIQPLEDHIQFCDMCR